MSGDCSTPAGLEHPGVGPECSILRRTFGRHGGSKEITSTGPDPQLQCFFVGDVSVAGQVRVIYDGGRGAEAAHIRESSDGDNVEGMLNVGLWRDKATKDLAARIRTWQ